MDFTTISVCGMLGLLALLVLGVPLVAAFLITGILGTTAILGFDAALSLLGETLYTTIATPTFTVLPLFMLMGSFAARGGFAKQAFDCIHIMFALVPASLAIASSFGSAAFGSICGSSMATASVFGKVAYPAMSSRGYDKAFALGSIASAGTFACMIPPSGMFILFSLFTGVSVAQLFMAGIIPGVLTACIFSLFMYLRAKVTPTLAPISEDEYQVTILDRVKALIAMWPIMLLGGGVIVGMYTGFFTATEAGGVGALGTLVFGIANGKLRNWETIKASLRESANGTAMLVFIIVTAMFFSRFLTLTQLPMDLAEALKTWNIAPLAVLLAIIALWFLLGMFMAQAAVFALTLPILFPVAMELGFNPIWFCIIAMMLNEIAGISPPVGLNAFALAGAVGADDKDVTIERVYKGCIPFILIDLLVVVILFFFPDISTFLPTMMVAAH